MRQGQKNGNKMQIYFEIVGTAEYQNPLPKLKMTGNQSWTKQAKRYVAYRHHVQALFLKSLSTSDSAFNRSCVQNIALGYRPIVLEKTRAKLEIFFLWKGETHADPENALGAIADALFDDDKHVEVHADFDHAPKGAGSLAQVTITL
jgi:hypothetical protein